MSIEEEKQKLKNSLRYEENSYSWEGFTMKEMDEILNAAAILAARCSYEISTAENGATTMADRTSNEEIFISKSFLMKAAKHRVETLDDGKFTSGVNMALELLKNIIENAPEADIAYIKRGHWIFLGEDDGHGDECEFESKCSCTAYRCSNCKKIKRECELTDYCPSCGAKMKPVVKGW